MPGVPQERERQRHVSQIKMGSGSILAQGVYLRDTVCEPLGALLCRCRKWGQEALEGGAMARASSHAMHAQCIRPMVSSSKMGPHLPLP